MQRLTASLVLLVLIAGSSWAADEFDFTGEYAKTWTWLAKEHAKLGKDYAGAELFTDARTHYLRALDLEPRQSIAMKGLGFKKRRGKWVQDKPLPKPDGVEGDAARNARQKPDKSKARFYRKAAARLKALAQKAADSGLETESRIVYGDLLYYSRRNREALKARGQVIDADGQWVPAFVKRARKRGGEVLAGASAGEKDESPDGQAIELKTTFHRRKSKWLICRTSKSEIHAKELHRSAQGCVRYAAEILHLKDAPFEGDAFTLTSLSDQKEYLLMCDKFSGKSGEDLEHVRKLSGSGQSDPWGYFCYQKESEYSIDMLSNTASLQVLRTRRRGWSMPWINTGFSYLVTARVLGTTHTKRFTVESQGATTARRGKAGGQKEARGPALMRALVLDQVKFKRDVALRALAGAKLNEIRLKHAAKSFSLFEFFFETYPKQTRQWLTGKPGTQTEELKSIEQAFGKLPTELESEWRRWVLANY